MPFSLSSGMRAGVRGWQRRFAQMEMMFGDRSKCRAPAAYKRFAASSASSDRSPFCSSMCAAMGCSRNLLTT